MRKRRLIWNIITSILYQIVTIICGFVLPRLILIHYGSEINGLVNSISQFLGMISFLELGVGAVVSSSLYKPLADGDSIKVSQIIVSANRFFRRLAQILLVYIVVLVVLYPKITHETYDWLYTATLIVAISISSFAQYYFGVVDRLLLIADQHSYIQYITMLLTLVINTVICVVLMKSNCSIQTVKLATSIIYLIRPIYIRCYVNKHYKIDRKVAYTEEPIKQKWNGVAQHTAAVILDSTDNIILTLFSTFSAISIYSVYHNVVYGVKLLLMSTTNGIQSILGELWAKGEKKELVKVFDIVEWLMHTAVIFIFGCTIMLIMPFISVYTKGVTDIDYIQPLFAVLITLANASHCLRLPYSMMILAAGHYKQTQRNYVTAAIMNIIISVMTVRIWGLVGVAIGTLVAMLYQTIWMAIYSSRNLVNRPLCIFIKQLCVDGVGIIIAIFMLKVIGSFCETYFQWFRLAALTALIWLIIVGLINIILYHHNFVWIIEMCRDNRKLEIKR